MAGFLSKSLTFRLGQDLGLSAKIKEAKVMARNKLHSAEEIINTDRRG